MGRLAQPRSPSCMFPDACTHTIEVIDIEYVLGNLAGMQIEKKDALMRICPRSGLWEIQWGKFNFALINRHFEF